MSCFSWCFLFPIRQIFPIFDHIILNKILHQRRSARPRALPTTRPLPSDRSAQSSDENAAHHPIASFKRPITSPTVDLIAWARSDSRIRSTSLAAESTERNATHRTQLLTQTSIVSSPSIRPNLSLLLPSHYITLLSTLGAMFPHLHLQCVLSRQAHEQHYIG